MPSRVVGLMLIAVCLGACASRAPFELRILTPSVELPPGGEQRVEAELINTGRAPLRLTDDAKLRYSLECRRPIDRPGEGALIHGTAFEGGVWGGITDIRPDPDDPQFCRSHPPQSIEVPGGGSRKLEALVEAPSSCVEGEVELELFFGAPDYGRHCPGIWYGETPRVKWPGRIRHPATVEAIVASASPAVLQCELAPGREANSVVLTLRNPTASVWRARVLPSLELMPAADPESQYWAPISPAGGEVLELAPGAESSRQVALAELAWLTDYDLRPETTFDALPRGAYTAALWMEVVGGKSWELRCPTAAVELRVP